MRASLAVALLVLASACGYESKSPATGTPHDGGRTHVEDASSRGTAGSRGTGGTGATGTKDAGAKGTGGSAGSELDAGAVKDCGPACRGGLPSAAAFHKCCGSTCADTGNDLHNCGACGHECGADAPYCHFGMCEPTPCQTSCDGGSCCGFECCGAGETCCGIGGPMGPTPQCVALAGGEACPFACYDCMCASPTTPIATPTGERPIADLTVGDLVYSVDHDAVVAVPIARVNRTAVPATHRVLRVTLANGRTLDVSGGHPLATDGTFDDLAPGSTLEATQVSSVQSIQYGHPFTYDILPASDTGTYFAAGVRIGSTLAKLR